MEGVANFRDVGRLYNEFANETYLRTATFFRSGRLDQATANDLQRLKDECQIKTIIDLRSEVESHQQADVATSFPASIAHDLQMHEALNHMSAPSTQKKPKNRGEAQAADEAGSVRGSICSSCSGSDVSDLVKEKSAEEDASDMTKTHTDIAGSSRRTFHINFAGNKFRKHGVWKPLPLFSKLKAIGLLATMQKPKVVELVGQKILQPGGLAGLNRKFVDYCGKNIVSALRVIAEDGRLPCLIHCTQGKDRTGLVVAMALALLHVPRAYILEDYQRSQEGLDSQRAMMIEEMHKAGLDASFSDAPANVMDETLDYIQKQYGSCHRYLNKNGLSEADIQSLRSSILHPDATLKAEAPC